MNTIRHAANCQASFIDGDGRGKGPSSSGRGEMERVGEDDGTIDADVV